MGFIAGMWISMRGRDAINGFRGKITVLNP
jgi:hypothetical protein